VEFDDQKSQLVELHQQRIEVRLNDRKRESMDHYLDAIQEPHPRAAKLLASLEKYIKAEEKDRQHTLNRFRHMLNTDADAAKEEEPTTLSHLRDLDQRINESMKMLNRVPASIGKEVERKARISWEELRNRLFGYGISNDQLVTQYKQQVTAHRQRDHISRQRKLEDLFDHLEEAAESDDDDDELQVGLINQHITSLGRHWPFKNPQFSSLGKMKMSI
jgi:E2 domain of amyloid precursor protein